MVTYDDDCIFIFTVIEEPFEDTDIYYTCGPPNEYHIGCKNITFDDVTLFGCFCEDNLCNAYNNSALESKFTEIL